MLLCLLLSWYSRQLSHAKERYSVLAVSYFPPDNSATVGFNGAMHNDFKTIDKSPHSIQNYRR